MNNRSASLLSERRIMTDNTRPITCFGIQIDSLSKTELIEHMMELIEDRQRALIANVNIHALNLAWECPRMHKVLREADYVFCDGVGVQWGVRFLNNQRIQHRITPPDWIDDLSAACVKYGYTLYFVGGKEGVSERAADRLRERHEGLQILGTHHGFFSKTQGHPENARVVAAINAVRPDILVVGFGMPLQELWIQENLAHLDVHIILPVGGLFDYLSGDQFRAPRWVTDNGFEWLARLVIEPRRLWRRYLIGIPLFFYRILLVRTGLDRVYATSRSIDA